MGTLELVTLTIIFSVVYGDIGEDKIQDSCRMYQGCTYKTHVCSPQVHPVPILNHHFLCIQEKMLVRRLWELGRGDVEEDKTQNRCPNMYALCTYTHPISLPRICTEGVYLREDNPGPPPLARSGTRGLDGDHVRIRDLATCPAMPCLGLHLQWV